MTMARVVPYGRQSISEQDIAAVVEVLRGDYLTQGPAVERFEKAITDFVGCKHAIVVNSGTAALHIAYSSMGVGPGDAVIVPAITFAATANAAVYCGAIPVFADVDPSSGLMTAGTCREAIKVALKHKLRPKLIVPVHYAGLPVDMANICAVAADYDSVVFEDACHALGAEYRQTSDSEWRKVGNWGESSSGAAFSFHPVKHIATGEGGAIVTNCDKLAAKSRLLRTHGITKDPQKFENAIDALDSQSGQINPWYYEMQELGWNFRMSDILAALGASQLTRLLDFVARRRQIAGIYNHALAESNGVLIPSGDSATSKNSWHLYALQVNFQSKDFSRAALMQKMREVGIGSQVHYVPVPKMPFYKRMIADKKAVVANLSQAQLFYDRVLSIPLYPELTREEVDGVCAFLQNEFKN